MRRGDNWWLRVARDNALTKQGYRCIYCLGRLSRSEATADHYRSRKKHGTDFHDNIVAACFNCNQAKGAMHGDEFRRLLKKDPPDAHYRIHLVASLRRIELRSQRAQKRILALVGIQFDGAAP